MAAAELLGARPPHPVSFDALLPLALDKEAAAESARGGSRGEEDDEDAEQRAREQEARLGEALRWLSGQMRVEPRRLLVATGDGALARAGRAGGFFTCLVQPRGANEEARVDYRIEAWEELRDVVEDLNGVSLRPWPPR